VADMTAVVRHRVSWQAKAYRVARTRRAAKPSNDPGSMRMHFPDSRHISAVIAGIDEFPRRVFTRMARAALRKAFRASSRSGPRRKLGRGRRSGVECENLPLHRIRIRVLCLHPVRDRSRGCHACWVMFESRTAVRHPF
jgi:hypothetical protein